MTLMILDSFLIILLLFGIKAVKEFYDKYREFLSLKDELNCVLRHVQVSMQSAQGTIDQLQKNIEFAMEHVTPHLPEAHQIKDDLEFLIDHSKSMADRLEKLTKDAKETFFTPQTVVFDPTKHSGSKVRAQTASLQKTSQSHSQDFDQENLADPSEKNDPVYLYQKLLQENKIRQHQRNATEDFDHSPFKHPLAEESPTPPRDFFRTIAKAR